MSEKRIPIYDSNNKLIKYVYSRYAVQQVIKGNARWNKTNTAIYLATAVNSQTVMHIITQVFSCKNDKLTIAQAMAQLSAFFPGDPYARYKASGSLGGASRSGYIVLLPNGIWQRVR